MGMSKEEKALMAQLQAAIANLSAPKSNPAQDFLTNQAIGAANWLQGGDYRTPPKGMFFNFEMPADQMKQYQTLTNVGKTGTFGLAGNSGGGRTAAQALQGQYLGDKFARDTMNNYQNNIRGAAGNVQAALGQAAGAQTQNQLGVIDALNGMFGNLTRTNTGSGLGSLLGGIGSIASAFL